MKGSKEWLVFKIRDAEPIYVDMSFDLFFLKKKKKIRHVLIRKSWLFKDILRLVWAYFLRKEIFIHKISTEFNLLYHLSNITLWGICKKRICKNQSQVVFNGSGLPSFFFPIFVAISYLFSRYVYLYF